MASSKQKIAAGGCRPLALLFAIRDSQVSNARLLRQSSHGWHAAICVATAPAAPHYCALLSAPAVASPQITQPNAVSRSPLEGDCRPSRADMT
jgi:hypothetical protein